jgi:type I restriction enzyme R subunit
VDTESNTRKQRIDPRLAGAGWSVRRFEPTYLEQLPSASAVEEWPTTAGPADYAMCEADSVLGVIEAKKLTIGAQGVLPQAERYSRAIKSDTRYQGEFGVPFLYSTNGEEIWFHDVRQSLNRSESRLKLLQSFDAISRPVSGSDLPSHETSF